MVFWWVRVGVACGVSSVCAINWLGIAAILEHAERYYGRSASTLNAVSNLYLGVYCVTCLPCGYLVDKNVRIALLTGAFTQALGAALTVIPGFETLVLGSCVAAVGQPLIVSTAAAFARSYVPERWTARVTTVVSVANNVGSAAAYLIAPRVVRPFGVRGWLAVRAAYALFFFLSALATFGRSKKYESIRYSLQVARLVRRPKLALLLAAYAIGQGGYWAWAELLDSALLGACGETCVGDVGAVVTVSASIFAVLLSALVRKERRSLELLLCGTQGAAAVAAIALVAATASKKLWAVALAWTCFSAASTPVMPFGAELAATIAPPHLVGAALASLFLGAELLSTAFGFWFGAAFEGPTLVFAVFLATALAALANLAMLLAPHDDDDDDDDVDFDFATFTPPLRTLLLRTPPEDDDKDRDVDPPPITRAVGTFI
ncbi:hypothetical protein CTAYLR_008821 [Chrysophaeum taylorii]|uniref:Major facilitator superfamily (MFS) profile domain-containing protein n=1 Tax=Chrysophaeum taylorii TaxID=2483200 RepID=A0AAD7XJY9_9STRA|nr:hypothetical protein CTAYLR_008821 [Chrysophaeum taylorii]